MNGATPTRRRLLSAALIALGGFGVGFVCAHVWQAPGGRAMGQRAEPAPTSVAVRTWAEAQVEARASDLPVLLLLTPSNEDCPPAHSMSARLFEGAGLAKIAECAVPARLAMNLAAPDAEASALLARVPQLVLPCLLVVGPDGSILHRQFGRLYPVYDLQGRPQSEGSEGGLLDAPAVVRLVDAAVGRGRREARRVETLRAGQDPAGWVEAAELLEGRGEIAAALVEARRASKSALAVGAALRVAWLLRRHGEVPAAVVALTQALERGPAEPERDRLALLLDRLTVLPVHAERHGRLPTLEAVLHAAEARGDVPIVLEARARIASHALLRGDRATVEAHLAWSQQHFDSLPGDADTGLAVLADLQTLVQGAEQAAIKVALLREVMRRYPEHPDAQDPKHGLLCEAEVGAGLRRE